MAAKYIRCMVVACVLVLVAGALCPAAIFFTKDIAPTPDSVLFSLCLEPTSLGLLLTAVLTFSGMIRRRGQAI